MATISSPRAQSPTPQRVQSPSHTPSSSVRPSVESLRPDGWTASPTLMDISQRRNRAALRDYYNLKSKASTRPALSRTGSATSIASNGTSSFLAALDDPSRSSTLRSQLDQEHFDPERYVQELLKSCNLKTLLKAEGTLVAEIKNLDGERKALVYDNYSKLIAATETIGTMRKSMDEAGEGSLRSMATLRPAVDEVVRSAAALDRGTAQVESAQRREVRSKQKEANSKREVVKWVLGTPTRLQNKLDKGQREEAQADWKEIKSLLDKWHQPKGSAQLRETCEVVMAEPSREGSLNGD